MDPTKNFDHLDPKLKETYARVMGTPTPAGNAPAPQYAPGQPAAPIATPPQNMNAGQNQFSQPSYGQPIPAPMPNQNAAPNPGTGPTINTMPMGATSMFSQPAAAPETQASAPANSSFFSNPSPAATEPSQPPAADTNLSAPFTPPASEPAQVPVTPYSPDATQAAPAIPVVANAEQFSQPLPSPASVAQNAPKETSALLRVLYIIADVVFFAIYTVFWIKVFNLPFLF